MWALYYRGDVRRGIGYAKLVTGYAVAGYATLGIGYDGVVAYAMVGLQV